MPHLHSRIAKRNSQNDNYSHFFKKTLVHATTKQTISCQTRREELSDIVDCQWDIERTKKKQYALSRLLSIYTTAQKFGAL